MNRVTLGAIVVAVLVVASVAVFGGFTERLLREKGDTYHAILADSAMLAKGSPVRVKGVVQGRISKLELRSDGRTADVAFELFEDSVPLYKDATATVQFRNVLGGNNALNIARGTPSEGELESRVIPESQTTGQVEVDQILSHLRDPERAGLQTMLDEFPEAMADADAPRAALASVAAASPNLAAGLAAARGERDGDLRRLIVNVASTSDALDDSPSQLMDIVEGGAITLETTARRNGDIRDTINGAATILPRVRTTLADLDGTLVKADRLLDALRSPAGEIAPAIRALRPAVVDTGTLLREARPLLGALRPAASALSAAARDGRPLLDELAPSLRRLDRTILTDLNKIDPTSKRSTAAMIGPTLSGLLGAASNIDQVAHMVGLGAASSERGITTLPCQTYFTDPTAEQLLKCENLAEALAGYLSYNPLDP